MTAIGTVKFTKKKRAAIRTLQRTARYISNACAIVIMKAIGILTI
jgi:hypothetical protein